MCQSKPPCGRCERRVVAALDVEEADEADHGERHELQHRRHHLGDARLAGAEDVHQREQPDRADRDECGQPVGRVDVAPEDAEVAGESDGDRGVADPGGDPVGPGRLEADEVAERAPGEVVGPARARVRTAEVREDEREQHRADAGEDERQDRRRACLAGEDRRQREDARADHVADHERGRHPQAHRPLQARLAHLRSCAFVVGVATDISPPFSAGFRVGVADEAATCARSARDEARASLAARGSRAFRARRRP